MDSAIVGFCLLHAALLLGIGVATLGALRLLKRMERLAPPLGARRVRFNRAVGDPFPVELLPADLRDLARHAELVFLFSNRHCGLCHPIVFSLPSFARDFDGVTFVVCTDEAWEETARLNHGRTRTVVLPELIRALGISLQPYAIRTIGGTIVELGVLNSPEHLESVLLSRVHLRLAAAAEGNR